MSCLFSDDIAVGAAPRRAARDTLAIGVTGYSRVVSRGTHRRGCEKEKKKKNSGRPIIISLLFFFLTLANQRHRVVPYKNRRVGSRLHKYGTDTALRTDETTGLHA